MVATEEVATVRQNSFDVETHDERQERYHALFRKLDVNKDGTICIQDLLEAFKTMDIPALPSEAEQLMTMSDTNQDGRLDLREFVQYLTEHEKKLQLEFKRIDGNEDGVLDIDDIVQAFQRLGIAVDKREATRLVKRMVRNKRYTISWDEWRNFLLLRPVTDIHDILHYWRHDTLIDIGEDLTVPKDFTPEELRTGMWWRYLVAGATAGAVSRTATAPLDRLKVLLMVHGSRERRLGINSGFRLMLSEGGISSLWRGNGINVIKIAPESAIKFMAYEQFKRLIKGNKEGKELVPIERFVAGAGAGAFAQTVIYPMEVLKTRLAIGKTGQYRSIANCAMTVFRHEGVASFYRGYIPNLVGIVPYAGIDLMVYEQLKKLCIARYPPAESAGELSVFALLLCGAASSTTGQFVSYPLALVRTRMQAAAAADAVAATSNDGGVLSLSRGAAGDVSGSDGMVAVIRSIVRHDGLAGLYRGLLPNFLKVAPAVSISYVVYETVSRALGIKMS